MTNALPYIGGPRAGKFLDRTAGHEREADFYRVQADSPAVDGTLVIDAPPTPAADAAARLLADARGSLRCARTWTCKPAPRPCAPRWATAAA